MADENEIRYAMMRGINFGGTKKKQNSEDDDKFHTKARKKGYQTGAHGSSAAKHKAEIRQRVKKRPTQRRK